MSTTNNTPVRFNCNYMREVILSAYNNGNRGVIKEKDCANLHIPEKFFDDYINWLLGLYDACVDVSRLRHNFTADIDAEKHTAALNKVFSLWKEGIGMVEPTTKSNFIRCNPADVEDLISFCWKFVKDANNVNGAKDFVAHKVYGENTKTDFRKKVEIMLGNMAAATTQLDVVRVRYLKEESKLLRKIKSNKSKVESCDTEIASLVGDIEKHKDNEELVAHFTNQLNSAKNAKTVAEKNVKGFTEDLAKLHADPDEYFKDANTRMIGEKKPDAPAPADEKKPDAPAAASKPETTAPADKKTAA